MNSRMRHLRDVHNWGSCTKKRSQLDQTPRSKIPPKYFRLYSRPLPASPEPLKPRRDQVPLLPGAWRTGFFTRRRRPRRRRNSPPDWNTLRPPCRAVHTPPRRTKAHNADAQPRRATPGGRRPAFAPASVPWCTHLRAPWSSAVKTTNHKPLDFWGRDLRMRMRAYPEIFTSEHTTTPGPKKRATGT